MDPSGRHDDEGNAGIGPLDHNLCKANAPGDRDGRFIETECFEQKFNISHLERTIELFEGPAFTTPLCTIAEW